MNAVLVLKPVREFAPSPLPHDLYDEKLFAMDADDGCPNFPNRDPDDDADDDLDE